MAEGKRGKRKDQRPARKRYWERRQLEKNKVKRMKKKRPGATNEELAREWRKARGNSRTPWSGKKGGAE